MTDIAALGLSIDSSAVPKATSELQAFSGAAKTAETATRGFVATANKVSVSAGGMSIALAKASTSAESINQRLNIRSGFDATARAADIAAYGDELDRLRAKFNPLFAVEKQFKDTTDEINKAARVGALTEAERTQALLLVESSYRKNAEAIKRATDATRTNNQLVALSSAALGNLSFQINDVITQALLGADPLRILAAQGGQFYQILQQGQGGVRGSLGYLKDLLVGLITPFRLAAAGALGLAGAGTYLGIQWGSAQRDIRLALSGVGAAAGVTAEDINRISRASADAGKMSVGSARGIALAFAATGKIGADLTQQLTDVTTSVAKLYGETTEEAAGRLASAFAEPAKGVEDLNKRLLAYDAATVQNIRSLSDQNRRFEAQQLLIVGIKNATAAAEVQTGSWERAWNKLAATISQVGSSVGSVLERAVGGGTLEQQLDDAQKLLARLKSQGGVNFRGNTFDDGQIAETTKRVEELTKAIQSKNKAEAEAPAIARSLDISKALDSAAPRIKELRDAEAILTKLNAVKLDPAAFSRLPADQQASFGRALEVAREQVASAKTRLDYDKSALEVAKEDQALALQSIAAKSAAQKADAAFQETLVRERRAGNPAADYLAEAARVRVLAEASDELNESIRNRAFSQQQAVEAAQLELSIVGRSVGETARLRANFEGLSQAKADAFRDRREVMESEIRLIDQYSDAVGRNAEALALRRLQADRAFDAAQRGRTEGEQEVYSRLQSAGLLTNGQITSSAVEAEAAAIRLDIAQRRNIETQKEFAETFIRSMVEGKSATEALGSALERLSSRLLDGALDQLFSGLFGGGRGSGGGLFGGALIAGVLHNGGIAGNDNTPSRVVPMALFAGAKRYHGGGVIGADEVPAILQRGERVIPRGGSSGGGIVVNLNTTIDAKGAYPESIAQITAAMAKMQSGLKSQVIEAVRDARSRALA